jgi:translation initiation factor 5B
MSGWLSQVDASGQPRQAVTLVYLFAAVILCSILPSAVAFTSLVSAGGVPTIAAYGLISLLRLTMTPNGFKNSAFYLGKHRRVFYLVAVLFNALIFAVSFIPEINPPVKIT